MNSAMTEAGSFGTQFGTQSKFGSTFGAESNFNTKFGSQFGAESSFGANSGSSLTAGSSSGLNTYMTEAERLAKMQAQSMSVGGIRTGGSQYGTQYDNAQVLGGIGSNAALTAGAGNSGYKTKSWEKASKWSSQSEVNTSHPSPSPLIIIYFWSLISVRL